MNVEWTREGSDLCSTIHGIPVRIYKGYSNNRGWVLQIGDRNVLKGSQRFLQALAKHNVEKMIEAGYDAANPK